MSASPHRVLLASAGSGKTFRLTSHLLRLLLEGVPPERVLATTFTRKAAGEILDRVLQRLLAALREEAKLVELREATGIAGLDRARCLATLGELTRSLGRLQVRTLDSFFVRLAQLYALELGLPLAWRIHEDDEDRRLRALALARVLDAAEPGEWLVLLRDLQRGAAARSVQEVVLRWVETLRALHLDATQAAWYVEAHGPEPAKDSLLPAIEAFEALELPRTKKGQPDKRWTKVAAEALLAARSGDWRDFIKNGLIQRVLLGEATYYGCEIPEEVGGPTGQLLAHARAALLGELRARNAAARTLLERFEIAYAALERERGSFGFGDLPRLLAKAPLAAGGEGWLETLAFRLDASIDHLLLDEFQDTAPAQWRVVAALGEELASDGTGTRSFFCVGDVKQSIYGWREAEPRLLPSLAAWPQLECERMDRSWRSSPVVLDTVERVFGTLAGNGALAGEKGQVARQAAEEWRAQYHAHVAARADLAGMATFWQLDPGEEPAQECALRFAADRAAAIHAAAPGATIGLLFRRRKHIPRMLLLLDERGVAASEEGGNPLTDSRAVQALLAALHLADHPGDRAAALLVASSIFARALGYESLEEDARSFARRTRRRLVEEGYGAFCQALEPIVAVGGDAWDRRRFAQLVDLASAWDARASLRPSDFVERVRGERVEDPSSERVKVMTIHASKGLEFDAVVLPELDLKLVQRPPAVLSERPDPSGPIERLSLRPQKEVVPIDADLCELDETTHRALYSEAFSLLYVAMTRAAARLEMVSACAPASGEPPCTFAGVIASALEVESLVAASTEEAAGAGEREGVQAWHHPDGDERTPAPRAEPEAARDEAASSTAVRRRASAPREPLLRRRVPSHGDGRARVVLRPEGARASRRGTLVHAWLEEVAWIEDHVLDPERLIARGAAIEPDADRLAALARAFAEQLESPPVRAALSRERWPGEEVELWRERDFAVVLPGEDGRGELVAGSFDRVTIRRAGGRVLEAEVLDFKTDRVEAAGVAGRVREHARQMEIYRRVLACMLGIEEERVRARLLFLAPGVLVEVGPAEAC